MGIIYIITAFLGLFYFIYPFWLMMFSPGKMGKIVEPQEINSVSLILISCNGRQYLHEKIIFLIKELAGFAQAELIIIDDSSTDGSKEVIENFRNHERVKIMLKNEQKGIPHSMNIGVENAKYETVIFCDQRQKLSDQILQRLVVPLKYRDIGAVSACLSHLDKQNCQSLMRRHENFLKAKESRVGSLIGVYGPLYAIKKSCYSNIPEYIILDDLYLSLSIIKSKQIKIIKECQIIDEDPSILYDYKRTKRYLKGFIQILSDKSLLRQLNKKQLTMLLWHKYLRLLIPFFLATSYIYTAYLGRLHIEFFVLFCALTLLGFVSALPALNKIQFRFKNFIRINILYVFAMANLFINDLLIKRFLFSMRKKGADNLFNETQHID